MYITLYFPRCINKLCEMCLSEVNYLLKNLSKGTNLCVFYKNESALEKAKKLIIFLKSLKSKHVLFIRAKPLWKAGQLIIFLKSLKIDSMTCKDGLCYECLNDDLCTLWMSQWRSLYVMNVFCTLWMSQWRFKDIFCTLEMSQWCINDVLCTLGMSN